MALTERETRELIRLLGKIGEADGFWPTEEAMRAAHSTISYWATELVITRNKGHEVLLALYEGGAEEFRGLWHIPGGYNRWDEPDIETTCSRVAKREIGRDVLLLQVLDAYKWLSEEHPYGRPLSLYCLCEPVGEIEEREALRFFPLDALPAKIVEPHRRFLGGLIP